MDRKCVHGAKGVASGVGKKPPSNAEWVSGVGRDPLPGNLRKRRPRSWPVAALGRKLPFDVPSDTRRRYLMKGGFSTLLVRQRLPTPTRSPSCGTGCLLGDRHLCPKMR
ncbi:hypothetical protein CB1_000245038 [Camelus ferus]|nr:hypothetical protein CB1_000245038 [Camelus ferus]